MLCPWCGAPLEVPTLRQMRCLEPADRRLGTRRRPRWDARRAWMFVGAVATTIPVLALLYLWAARPTPSDPREMTLGESWSAWMELRQGLDRQLSVHTIGLIEARRMLRIQTYMCFGAAAAGLAISISAFVMRRSRIARQAVSRTRIAPPKVGRLQNAPTREDSLLASSKSDCARHHGNRNDHQRPVAGGQNGAIRTSRD